MKAAAGKPDPELETGKTAGAEGPREGSRSLGEESD